MGTPSEHAALLSLVKSLRMHARDDKHKARTAFNEWWRAHARRERRRRLTEAWHYRKFERALRGEDSAATILSRAKEVERRQANQYLTAALRESVRIGAQ